MKAILFLAMTTISQACSGCTVTAPGHILDPNGPTAIAAVDIAQAVLNEEQPAVNAAIAELPPEVQALAQTAYGALQAVLKHLDAIQPTQLDVMNPNTVPDTEILKVYVGDVKDQLDSLIH